MAKDNSSPTGSRVRAIETDNDGRRPLRDLLDDARYLYDLALGRQWKGNDHPDFNGAGNALKLEAQLSGYMLDVGKGKGAGATDDPTTGPEVEKQLYAFIQRTWPGQKWPTLEELKGKRG